MEDNSKPTILDWLRQVVSVRQIRFQGRRFTFVVVVVVVEMADNQSIYEFWQFIIFGTQLI